MNQKIVILGNGGSGFSAIKTLISKKVKDQITVVSKENLPHYSPIILPYLIEKRIVKDDLFFYPIDFYEENGINTLFGEEVVSVDSLQKQIVLKDNSYLGYDKLLIAVGSSPRFPAIEGIHSDGVFALRTLEDTEKVINHVKDHLVILGAGPVAIEIAIAFKKLGKKVTIVGRSRLMRRLFDPDISEKIKNILVKNGITVHMNQRGTKIYGDPVRGVITEDLSIECDTVLIGMGIVPNISFLHGEKVLIGENGGLIADQFMKTSIENIYVAGDCAEVRDIISGKYTITGTWTSAIEQGKIAALNMMGYKIEYRGTLNMNTINIFETPVSSIGSLNGKKVSYFYKNGIKRITLNNSNMPIGLQTLGSVHGKGDIINLISRGLTVSPLMHQIKM